MRGPKLDRAAIGHRARLVVRTNASVSDSVHLLDTIILFRLWLAHLLSLAGRLVEASGMMLNRSVSESIRRIIHA